MQMTKNTDNTHIYFLLAVLVNIVGDLCVVIIADLVEIAVDSILLFFKLPSSDVSSPNIRRRAAS
jgi:hypothetical protein